MNPLRKQCPVRLDAVPHIHIDDSGVLGSSNNHENTHNSAVITNRSIVKNERFRIYRDGLFVNSLR